MKIKRSTYFGLGMISLTLAGFLAGCQNSEPKLTNVSPTPTVATTSSAQQAPATISQIQNKPVWLKRLNATSEIYAAEGMGVFIGEQIRTVDEALAEIELKNGLAFRIGGNSVLTLQPDNSLNLSKGEMITWVQPGKQVPAKVVTPGAIAGIRGTTIYVNIPNDPNGEIEYFTWEGTMSITLPNQSEEVLLKAGEVVKIKPGETDFNKMRKRVRKLTDKEWETRRNKSRLINNFVSPLPTLNKIDQVAPKGAKKTISTPQITKPTPNSKSNNNNDTPALKLNQPAPNSQINNNNDTPALKLNQPAPTSQINNNNDTPTLKLNQPAPTSQINNNNDTPALKLNQPAPTSKSNNNTATPTLNSPANSQLEKTQTPKPEPKQLPTPGKIPLTASPKVEVSNPTLKAAPKANPKETANSPNSRKATNDEHNKYSE